MCQSLEGHESTTKNSAGFYNGRTFAIIFDCSAHFNFYEPIASTRSSSPKLIKPVKGNNTVMFSFFNRAIDCWNFLPHNLRFCNSLPTFKRQLHNVDLSSFLVFQ